MNITLKNRTIRCKKYAKIFSGRKNVHDPSALMLTFLDLTKCRDTLFRFETFCSSFLHLMMLFFKMIFIHSDLFRFNETRFFNTMLFLNQLNLALIEIYSMEEGGKCKIELNYCLFILFFLLTVKFFLCFLSIPIFISFSQVYKIMSLFLNFY